MKNKIICLLLVMIMCVASLAACKKPADNNNNNNNENNNDSGNTNTNNGEKPNIGGGSKDEGEWWKNIAYDTTDLFFYMTKCTNDAELPSGCEQYLAGEGATFGEAAIDQLIAERNNNAETLTKVNVTYDYFPNDAVQYGFSKARTHIQNEIKSGNTDAPDMYCNWMTDLLICSLNGCFANLRSKSYGVGDYQGDNHFNLDNPGYMGDLMGSLTLSTDKIYVIASDYFIDLIRAFFVVPVNIDLFNTIAAEMYPDVANPTIDTFFEEVKPCNCENLDPTTACTKDCQKGRWNYGRLMQATQYVYQGQGTENRNDILGFGLGQNGLPAAGLIYTSSVTIIQKDWNSGAGKFDYEYPTSNAELYKLIGKVSTMMDVDGIMCFTQTDADNLDFTSETGRKTPLLAVRHKFTQDEMLFGGIILVGSLEEQVYQDMKSGDRGGFGVVPVPVYNYDDESLVNKDSYLTQIHVVGRAGAIRYNTEKFVQCSAFLHYQSSNSEAIKNDYYQYTLVEGAATGSGMEGNVEMLQYIRQNVRTSFDKLYEDAIGYMYADVNEDSVKSRFHNLLCDANYKLTNIQAKYEELQGSKASALVQLEAQYEGLPS